MRRESSTSRKALKRAVPLQEKENLLRLRIMIRGAVQGVGFRPFIYRLATDLGLKGWVINSSQGVFIEVEGEQKELEQFLLRIEREKPTRSFIQSLESSFLDPAGYESFEIRKSDEEGTKTALVLPDIATCPDCLREVFDPKDRRHLYPFTNCTNCGPRFSIIEALPYDRPNTTMEKFTMCNRCQAEYDNPLDRRFHAQPNACPDCGPHLELWDADGKVLALGNKALLQAAEAVRRGEVLAMKGLGGFLLIVDARNEEAVLRLRQRKGREEKPFALLSPTLELIKEHCDVSELEERLLLSPECPILLLRRRPSDKRRTLGADVWCHSERSEESTSEESICVGSIAPAVAPRNPYLGVMLPYTPLHHILIRELGFPVVATSGNLSDEPICTNEAEALERLGGIADLFLVHNRPIMRHVDDSIVRVIMGRELVMRRARGYAPLPVRLKDSLPSILAVGGHLKNTVALTSCNNVFVSQHIGDLETEEAFNAFRRVIESFQKLYPEPPERIACDLHPDYISSQYAKRIVALSEGTPVPYLRTVQHHLAHVLACMAENEIEGPCLGVSWDGTGYGLDGTVWGGEFLLVCHSDPKAKNLSSGQPSGDPLAARSMTKVLCSVQPGFERVAHLRTFRLPGGERAVREPRRAALGLLYEVFRQEILSKAQDDKVALFGQTFSVKELGVLVKMLERGINSPVSSSAGRLFDAVSSILGLCQVNSFEGQAAMELEFALHCFESDDSYPFLIDERESALLVDWGPLIRGILDDLAGANAVGMISAKFHNTLAEMIVEVARRVGEERVVLTGGCFQNRYLTERAVVRLQEEGFRPYWHQRIPPNDGGISLGQAVAASWEMRNYK